MVSRLQCANATSDITLDDDQVAGIRALVAAGQAASVSGFVKHAVGVAIFDAARWNEFLEEALQQGRWAADLKRASMGLRDSFSPGRKRHSRKGKAA